MNINNNILNEEIKVDYKENDDVNLNLNIFDENEKNNNNHEKKKNEDNKIEFLKINFDEIKMNKNEIDNFGWRIVFRSNP